MNLRNVAVLVLSVVAFTTLAIASLAPAWDVIRLVGLAAITAEGRAEGRDVLVSRH